MCDRHNRPRNGWPASDADRRIGSTQSRTPADPESGRGRYGARRCQRARAPASARRTPAVGRAGQSGKGTGGGVLRGGQHAVDAAKPEGIERAIAADLVVVLLQEPEQPPRIAAEHGEEAG